MKLSKLMLTMAVAASAFAACNKQDTTPVGTNYKSVEFSLENVNFTKAPATSIVTDADKKVNLASFQVFFTDGSVLYAAKEADNQTPAQDYFTKDDLTKNLVFHFLDPKVKEVVVIGNESKVTVTDGVTTLTSLERELLIANEQHADEVDSDLTLYARETLALDKQNVEHVNDKGIAYTPGHTVDVYKANVTLVPRVARIEIVGYECEFSNPALYDEVTIDQVAIDGYKSTAKLAAATYDGLVDAVNPGNQVALFNYFAANQNAMKVEGAVSAWWFDMTSIELTSAAATKSEPMLAYHVFPGATPELLVDITTTKGTVEMPAYLYTKALSTSKPVVGEDGKLTYEALTSVEAGKIYRLTLKFKDTDLTQQDKCVEIVVDVDEWEVVPVYPIF